MPSRFEKYRVKDGLTKLGEAYFNPVFQDIDLRLSGIEALRISWEDAAHAVTEYGLVRINEVIGPTLSDAISKAEEIETKRQAAIAALAEMQFALDAFEAAGLADILAWKDGVSAQIAALSASVESAEASATADISAWKDAHLDEIAALLDHAAASGNPHGTTAAQVGLGNVSNDAQLKAASNLADLPDKGAARIALALGNAATKNTGTATGTVANGDHAHAGIYEPAAGNIQTHIATTGNPHGTTAAQVGLGNLSNDAQLKAASNLADLPDKEAARTALKMGLVHLQTQVISAAVASVDFTGIDATYSRYVFFFDSLSHDAATDKSLQVRFQAAGIWQNANYDYAYNFTSTAGVNTPVGATLAGQIVLTPLFGLSREASGVLTLHIPSEATASSHHCRFEAAAFSGATFGNVIGAGRLDMTGTDPAVTGVRFMPFSGALDSGRISMYGVKE